MIYTYRCLRVECDRGTFDITKSVKAIDDEEICPTCLHPAERIFNPGKPQIMNAGDGWNDHAVNPAFGKVIGSKAMLRKELAEAKSRGYEMIEVGNEPVEKIHKAGESSREQTRNDRWRQAAREVGIPEA
jgi:hypothetical protein